jgi:GNAT superfamily N-acetyltransferase
MDSSIQIDPVLTRRDLKSFVLLPWKIYKDDPIWVPPLISAQLSRLDPARGPFYTHADGQLFLARRGREIVGSIAVFIDHRRVEHLNRQVGGFGFFEVIEDYPVAEALLDAAVEWLWERNISEIRGPTSFTDYEYPGVLVEGANIPPVLLAAHTPHYYGGFLESYGMERDRDLFAWRVVQEQVSGKPDHIPEDLIRAAGAALAGTPVTVRPVKVEDRELEIKSVHQLFNLIFRNSPAHTPMSLDEFQQVAKQMRPFLDPDLILVAEVESKPVGLCIAIPDINRVLMQLNGRLFPLGWLNARRMIDQIDVVSFKSMSILEEFRQRGIDALLLLESLKRVDSKGYAWLDCSVVSEDDPLVNLIANRMGAERYKHYRVYRLDL